MSVIARRWWLTVRPDGKATRVSNVADVRRTAGSEVVEVVPADQLRGAVARADWFRQAWANAQGCTVEEAERAFKTLGNITTPNGGQ